MISGVDRWLTHLRALAPVLSRACSLAQMALAPALATRLSLGLISRSLIARPTRER
jgi:hypothetical protein